MRDLQDMSALIEGFAEFATMGIGHPAGKQVRSLALVELERALECWRNLARGQA